MGKQDIQSSLRKSESPYRLSVFLKRFKKLNFQEKERRSTMAIIWLLLFAITTAVQTTVATKASEREDINIDFSEITNAITAIANATERNAKKIEKSIGTIERNAKKIEKLIGASRVCQTGTVSCEKCGGSDPAVGRTENTVEKAVSFYPHFAGTPTVTMATSKLFVYQENAAGDSWGFDNRVESLSASGFTAVLVQDDVAISEQKANWIACGRVYV